VFFSQQIHLGIAYIKICLPVIHSQSTECSVWTNSPGHGDLYF